jgi:hypothetical protein
MCLRGSKKAPLKNSNILFLPTLNGKQQIKNGRSKNNDSNNQSIIWGDIKINGHQ